MFFNMSCKIRSHIRLKEIQEWLIYYKLFINNHNITSNLPNFYIIGGRVIGKFTFNNPDMTMYPKNINTLIFIPTKANHNEHLCPCLNWLVYLINSIFTQTYFLITDTPLPKHRSELNPFWLLSLQCYLYNQTSKIFIFQKGLFNKS